MTVVSLGLLHFSTPLLTNVFGLISCSDFVSSNFFCASLFKNVEFGDGMNLPSGLSRLGLDPTQLGMLSNSNLRMEGGLFSICTESSDPISASTGSFAVSVCACLVHSFALPIHQIFPVHQKMH